MVQELFSAVDRSTNGGFWDGLKIRKRTLAAGRIRIGEGKQIIRTGKQDGIKLYLAERVLYYTVPKWDAALKDVRNVHFKP